MIVRIVTVRVRSGTEAAFEAATVDNHRGSIAEPGVLRFDVLKDADSPGTYYLYEAYIDEKATRAHKETAHYNTWRVAVADLLDGDRTSVACSVVAPDRAGW
ncbi:MAG: antibiotic biosynthesis monooxygenase [Spirochaetaceae bacterium]|nr:MAG: antibiotic biosynthesis monooxygenase [Spirochaetaceae bacterium]